MQAITPSRYPFAQTLSLLVGKIIGGGGTVFAIIDQAAAARGAGLNLRPTTLVVFGNPKAGTAIMEAFPSAGLDLPLKLLLWEDDDGVKVAFSPMAEVLAARGVTGCEAAIAGMNRVLEGLAAAVAAPA